MKGEPLPYPAAEELIEELFGNDLPGRGAWRSETGIHEDPPRPTLHLIAEHDQIAPSVTAPPGAQSQFPPAMSA